MKVRIINVKKFVSSIVIILGILIGFSFIINNSTFSHGETEYKTLYVIAGDTLWTIAKEEQYSNEYFEGKDIRDIIFDLKSINNLETSDLTIGEQLKIPVL